MLELLLTYLQSLTVMLLFLGEMPKHSLLNQFRIIITFCKFILIVPKSFSNNPLCHYSYHLIHDRKKDLGSWTVAKRPSKETSAPLCPRDSMHREIALELDSLPPYKGKLPACPISGFRSYTSAGGRSL